MSDAARAFTRVAQVGDIVAIACTPDGSLVAINDSDGRVWFYAVDASDPSAPQVERLPLRFELGDACGVLLHPDGRVISRAYEGDELYVRIHDPRSGALQRSFAVAIDEERGSEDEFGERPAAFALLERPSVQAWVMRLHIANAGLDETFDWYPRPHDDVLIEESYPYRFTRMALHPNRRWLAVLDPDAKIIDLESEQLLRTLDYWVPWELEETGTHTIGFDDRGLLTVATTTIERNPYVEVERIDVESGSLESTTTVWGQRWAGREDAPELEISRYEPCYFPPERILAGTYKVLFRRGVIETWSEAGLVRGTLVPRRTCVIPGFDPASFSAAPRALLVSAEQIELLDLVTGERERRRPPIGEPPSSAALTHIEFDAPHDRLLLWREHTALLVASSDSGPEEHWSVHQLPEGRRMSDWAFAGEAGRAFVVDDAGELWLADVVLAPRAARAQPSLLHALERELLARPHEAAPFLVYADALIERGDPRGELIMLQHQRAFDQADALIERHREALLGPLAELDPSSFELSWERGFVRAGKFHVCASDDPHRVFAFLASDCARLLESLELRLKGERALATYARIDAYLAAARHLPCLRSLQLGEPGQHTLSAKLLAALPRLSTSAERERLQ